LDSTFSYDSYTTGISSSLVSYNDDTQYPAGPEDSNASTSLITKGKGKATQIDELLSPFSWQAEATTSLVAPFVGQSLTNSHDVLGQYSPDVADLLPHFELERKAFDWAEFERSLYSSPGAGTSLSSPLSPIDSITSGLGLTLSSSVASPVKITDAQWPQINDEKFPSPNPAHATTSRVTIHAGEPTEQGGSSLIPPVTRPNISHTSSNRVRKHAVSMYETSDPDSNQRSISYRTSGIENDTRHPRTRADSTTIGVMSRPRSAGPSPRLKRRSLTLPSWLSKTKEGKGNAPPGGALDLVRGNGSPLSVGRDILPHRPRKLCKEKGRAQTTPVNFPFIVMQDSIVQDLFIGAEVTPEAADGSIKPVEEVSLFETLLPREMKLYVLMQLVVVHQEEFEIRLWVGKDAGMRELVKLSRVRTRFQIV